MATKEEIAVHLSNFQNFNAAGYIDSLQKAVEAITNQAVAPVYRTPQLGKTSVFMASPKVVDQAFGYKKYYEAKAGRFAAHPNISDRLRGGAGLYWTDKISQLGTDAQTKNQLCYMRSVDATVTETSIPLKMHFNTLAAPEEDELGRTIEWILLEGNSGYAPIIDPASQNDLPASEVNTFDATLFNAYLVSSYDATRQDGTQTDYTTSITQLTSKSEIDEQYGSATYSYADVHGDYNYLDRRYESTIHNIAVKPNTLPNMYVFFAYQDSEDPNPAFKQLLSLNNQIDLTNHDDMFHLQSSNAQVRATPSEKYFAAWTRTYANAISNGTVFNLNRSYQNILFSADDMATLAQYEAHKELFPMWMHIEFTTDKMTEFAETLKDSQLMGLLQAKLLDAIKTNALPIAKTFEARTVPMNGVTAQSIASPEASPMMKQVYANNNRRIFDLTTWMDTIDSDSLTDSTSVGLDTLFSTFLGTYKFSDVVSNHPKYRFYKSLLAIILKGKVKKLLKKHMRTVQEVFEGKSAYHETVLYKVSKYAGPNTNGEPIQSFYIPNSNDLDVFTYIDTQVKYDTQYTYSITAYELVVGNKYQYQELVSKVQYGKWAAVQVINEPSLRLVEVPIYVHTNRVLDNPPIHPEVEFVPYKGINNKIKILVNSGVGRYDIPFEIIESEEMEQVNKHKRAQNKLHTDNTLMYETDDYPAFFEVRRMLKKPKSFGDFAGKKIKLASTTLKNTEMISSGMGIVDKIKPNTKYYYCIRAIDNHGHISYPSPIYEVEMVDDAGSIYPIVRICEFAPEFESQPAIGGRRYIHIQPTMPQLLVNEENSGLIEVGTVANLDKLNLSISEETVWGKKFKIRLTSKSTGRKMDFNVSFEHQHLKLKNRD
tara:strand:+ start:1291 stop:3930 length:2640 start_codon:yes stop_codon:yes gene_type:complete